MTPIDRIKSAARGRWPEIIASLGGVDPERLTGKHGPCPLCGGTDRFRSLDDFEATGAVYCNKCLKTRNGDGIAALGWLRGWDFQTVLKELMTYLHIEPAKSNGKPRPEPSGKNGQSAHPQPGNKALLFQLAWPAEQTAEHNELIAKYCQAKPPISPEAIAKLPGKFCWWPRKRSRYPSLAVRGRNIQGEMTSITVLRLDGEPYPAVGNLSARKSHNTKGSKESWIWAGTIDDLKAATVIVKVEGITDLLAILSVDLPPGWLALTNSCGAGGGKNLDYSFAAGKPFVIVHDCDVPGQEGMRRFAVGAAEAGAAEVKLLDLGYPIAPDHGRDLRDWLQEHPVAELVSLVENTTPAKIDIPRKTTGKSSLVRNADVFDGGGDGGKTVDPIRMEAILDLVAKAMDGWPRRVGNALFADDPKFGICWLETASSLFGWMSRRQGVILWARGTGCVTREELFCELQRTATDYETIERVPHEPQIPRHYYACETPEPGDGSAVEKLLDFFQPETDLDRSLLLGAFLTPLWGGPTGRRPAHLFVARQGRGIGKSVAVQLIGQLYGGVIDFSAKSDVDNIKKRLLSPEARTKRVALLDNVKSLKFSSAEIESLITADEISGHRLYLGEGTRPNHLAWFITLNGPSLSTDMAQRTVEVRFARPKYTGSWESDVRQYIADNRNAILGDLIGILRGPRQDLGGHSRWAAWERGVLACVPDAAKCYELIIARRGEADAECEELELIEDYFADKLRWLEYDTDKDDVFIPATIATKWYNAATGEAKKTVGVTRILKQMRDEEKLWRIVYYRRGGSGSRGFRWIGEHALDCYPTIWDLGERLAKKTEQQNVVSREYGETSF